MNFSNSNNFLDNDAILLVKVLSCEEFERSNGRFEDIYGVDLLFDAEDSVSGFLIEEELAVQVKVKLFSLSLLLPNQI